MSAHRPAYAARKITTHLQPPMSEAYSVADTRLTYLANVVLRPGRNEIQFYELNTKNGGSPAPTPATRVELDSDSQIVAVSWLNDAAVPAATPSGKRKHAENGLAAPAPSLLFAVAFALGDLWVYSPGSETPVAQVLTDPVLAMAGGQNSVWVLTLRGVAEVHVLEGKVGKTVLVQGSAICVVDDKVVVAGGAVTVIKKGRKRVVAERGDAKLKKDKAEPDVKSVAATPSAIAVAHTGGVTVYTFAGAATELRGTFARVRVCGDRLAAFGETVQLIEDGEVTGTVEAAEGSFENLLHGETGTWAVHYDGLEPRFVPVDSSLSGRTVVDFGADGLKPAKANGANGSHGNGHTDQLVALANSQHHHDTPVPTGTLLQVLRAKLADSDDGSVLSVCASNFDDTDVRTAVRQMAPSEAAACFKAVAPAVAASPLQAHGASVWLKWLLLAHGASLAKNPERLELLRGLQASLTEGVALMDKLTAIQGRLELLKLQAELRTLAPAAESEEEFDTANDTINNTTNIEESVLYVNGENDDDVLE